DQLAQSVCRQCRAAQENTEQGITGGHMIANLMNYFNDTISTLGQGQKSLWIERQNHAVVGVKYRRGRLGAQDARSLRRAIVLVLVKMLRINAFDDLARTPGDYPQRTAWAQRFAEVINQVEEDSQANETTVRRYVCGKQRNGRFDPDQSRE